MSGMGMEAMVLVGVVIVGLALLAVGVKNSGAGRGRGPQSKIAGELAKHGLKLSGAQFGSWYEGRNNQTRTGCLIKMRGRDIERKIIYTYDTIQYVSLEIDNHQEKTGSLPGSAEEPTLADDLKMVEGALSISRDRQKVDKACLSVQFSDGNGARITLTDPGPQRLELLTHFYYFLAAQAASNQKQG